MLCGLSVFAPRRDAVAPPTPGASRRTKDGGNEAARGGGLKRLARESKTSPSDGASPKPSLRNAILSPERQ
jgi:hypothetical protein